MDFSKIFACGGLFPISFGVFTSYKSQKNRLRRCDVSFVHLYKRPVGKQKLQKSERAASEFFVPVSGEITGINDSLSEEPGVVNTDPMEVGWFFSIRLADTSELEKLMNQAQIAEAQRLAREWMESHRK